MSKTIIVEINNFNFKSWGRVVDSDGNRVTSYKGRRYRIEAKSERVYTATQRFFRGLRATLALIFTLGAALASRSIRKLYTKKSETLHIATPLNLKNCPNIQKKRILKDMSPEDITKAAQGNDPLEFTHMMIEDLMSWKKSFHRFIIKEWTREQLQAYLNGFIEKDKSLAKEICKLSSRLDRTETGLSSEKANELYEDLLNAIESSNPGIYFDQCSDEILFMNYVLLSAAQKGTLFSRLDQFSQSMDANSLKELIDRTPWYYTSESLIHQLQTWCHNNNISFSIKKYIDSEKGLSECSSEQLILIFKESTEDEIRNFLNSQENVHRKPYLASLLDFPQHANLLKEIIDSEGSEIKYYIDNMTPSMRAFVEDYFIQKEAEEALQNFKDNRNSDWIYPILDKASESGLNLIFEEMTNDEWKRYIQNGMTNPYYTQFLSGEKLKTFVTETLSKIGADIFPRFVSWSFELDNEKRKEIYQQLFEWLLNNENSWETIFSKLDPKTSTHFLGYCLSALSKFNIQLKERFIKKAHEQNQKLMKKTAKAYYRGDFLHDKVASIAVEAMRYQLQIRI